MGLKGLGAQRQGLEGAFCAAPSQSVKSVGQYQEFIFNSHNSSQGSGERGEGKWQIFTSLKLHITCWIENMLPQYIQ